MSVTPYAANGAKFYVSASAVYSEPASAAAYEALVWEQVSGVESMGEYGDEAQIITAADLQASRMFKAKGPRDAGTLALTVLDAPSDTGQQRLVTAESVAQNYAFKVELPNKLSEGGTNELQYFIGLVSSKRQNVGNVSNIVRRTFNIAINSQITHTAAT